MDPQGQGRAIDPQGQGRPMDPHGQGRGDMVNTTSHLLSPRLDMPPCINVLLVDTVPGAFYLVPLTIMLSSIQCSVTEASVLTTEGCS